MAFIEPMHRNKPNITYLLTAQVHIPEGKEQKVYQVHAAPGVHILPGGTSCETEAGECCTSGME